MTPAETSFPFVPKWVLDEMATLRKPTEDEQRQIDEAFARYRQATIAAQEADTVFTQARLTVIAERANFVELRSRMRAEWIEVKVSE